MYAIALCRIGKVDVADTVLAIASFTYKANIPNCGAQPVPYRHKAEPERHIWGDVSHRNPAIVAAF